MIDWDEATRNVSYNLAIWLHRLFAVAAKTGHTSRLRDFLGQSMPWTYPLIGTTRSMLASELTPASTYWALTGLTLLVPWRLSQSMQGIGKTTAAFYFACRPMTWEFWRELGLEFERGRPPFDTLEDCVNAIVNDNLFINDMNALSEAVGNAEAGNVKYPVIILDDLGAWASSRDMSVWRKLTALLTTMRKHVGVVIGTAAALNHVFFDIRRNATLIGETGQYRTNECGGIRTTWVRCVDTRYLCNGRRSRLLIDVGFGSMSTLICMETTSRIWKTEGYTKANTELRGRLVRETVMGSLEDLMGVLKVRCNDVACTYASAAVGEDALSAKCVVEFLRKYGIEFNVQPGVECVGVSEIMDFLKTLIP